MDSETKGLMTAAELMAVSARTAPKAKGSDVISVKIVSGDELNTLADSVRKYGEEHKMGFFIRDSENIRKSGCCLLIGARSEDLLGLNCSACGCRSCAEMQAAYEMNAKSEKDTPFKGPVCAIRQADLGIAAGSAVKTASMLNIDCRIMYTAGVGALRLGWLPGCPTAYGIPLSVTGKSIYFDRE